MAPPIRWGQGPNVRCKSLLISDPGLSRTGHNLANDVTRHLKSSCGSPVSLTHGALRVAKHVEQQTELLLVGVRGGVAPFGLSARNIIRAPATKHSRKPAEARHLIDQAAARSFTDPR